MTLDWDDVVGAGRRAVLVANLPYNVATPLVADVLDDVPQIERMLVMVQREVAERFAAAPRTPAYGAVSVKVAYWATARIVGLVPASVFVPRPNVESALVEIVRRQPPATPIPTRCSRSSARRSTSGARCSAARSPASSAPEQFAAAGIEPTARPEELDVAAWCSLDASAASDGCRPMTIDGLVAGDVDALRPS